MGYLINRTEDPPICLPTSIRRDRLVDITPVGAAWRVFMDEKTGKTYDGALYFKNLTKGTP